MNEESMVLIIVAVLSSLLGGGLIGTVISGFSAKSQMKKTGADALKTYQEIANIASESLLASQLREKESQARFENIVMKLEEESKLRLEENTKLKRVVSAWSVGIQVLYNQLESMDQTPRWRPEVDDLSFLALEKENKNVGSN